MHPGKLLVLVPHQDDELNIAGQLLPTFIESGWECKVCFSTNGDGFKSNGPVRTREAMKAAEYLGIGSKNLVFLGFDDSMGPDHPYGRVSDAAIASAPPTKTYSDEVACYSALRSGATLPQCRRTLVADIEHMITYWKPDSIICIDYDSHPDHRALSLAFEEALGSVLVRDTAYRPLVLKKFAYSSIWYGPADYSSFAPTMKPEPCGPFELDNPMYAWEDRVRVAPHPSTTAKFFFSNAVVKAAMRYPSQNAWWHMASVCNSDVVYWVRRTDNLVFDGEVETSSGNAQLLHSFLLFDSRDVCSNDMSALDARGFRFNENDAERTILVAFDKLRRVAEVTVREAVGSFGSLDHVSVSFNGGATIFTMSRSTVHPGRLELSLETPVFTREIILRFGEGANRQMIASVEAYPTYFSEYAPLEALWCLAGVFAEIEPTCLRLERVFGQVARITRKIANIKLRHREKKGSNCQMQ